MDNMANVFENMQPMCVYRARDLVVDTGLCINEVRRNLKKLVAGIVVDVVSGERKINILFQTKQERLF